jgi:tripartite ATP-independent transporter DctM subunit
MEWWVALTAALVLLLGLFATGLPIFICFMVFNVVGLMVFFGETGFGLFASSIVDTTTTSSMVTVPLFVLMGEFLFRSGSIDRLYKAIDKLVGRTRIRLYVLSILLSTVLGALSGSAMAVAAMLGRSILPGLKERGYDRKISIGTILAGASLAPIIPPSVLAIVVGTMANVSIAKLLIAGVLPGLFLAVLFCIYIFVRVLIDPSKAPPIAEGHKMSLRVRLSAISDLAPFGVIIFCVLGVIMLGIATPEEAAATGAIAALALGFFLSPSAYKIIAGSLAATARTTAMIMIIMASSMMFTQLLAYSGLTTDLVEAVTTLGVNKWVMLLVLMAVPFVMCMFIDQIAFMLIAIPIYLPLIDHLQFDPIWFWALFLINITVGGITPPFGYTLFALKSADQSLALNEIFAAAWPFVWIFCIGVLLMALVPEIVLFLPSLL